jgi:hypothetical protein
MVNLPKTLYVKRNTENNVNWLQACESLDEIIEAGEAQTIGVYKLSELQVADLVVHMRPLRKSK